jgi:hypothetical protein
MTARRVVFALILAAAAVIASYPWWRPAPRVGGDMNGLAERYVRLVLAVGQHDRDYVDAYYGPPEWRKEAELTKVSLEEIDEASVDLAGDLAAIAPPATAAELTRARHRSLTRQLDALRARVAILNGTTMPFDEESKALYDAVAPSHTEAEFLAAIAELDKRLPGDGPLLDRYETYRLRFVIPRARLDATFRTAINECRARTRKHVRLPDDESFTVEYVTGKTWSAYNWYQGGYRSVIQVNTDLPIHADWAVLLACHEGYPGHHAYNVILEKNFVRDRGWREFSVYPLFTPQSLIAEGTADYGVRVAFPGPERAAFARDVVFPAAGIDPSTAAGYYEVVDLAEQLAPAGDEAARQYLDGRLDAEGAIRWLETYALYSRARAQQRLAFVDQYRSYVINYTVGKDLVARWIESQGGTDANPARRWQLFEELISSPRLPSSLVP